MNSVHSEFKFPEEIYKKYVKTGKFNSRMEALLTQMQTFIDMLDASDKVCVNEMVLGCALIDYYADILRMKTFHDMPHSNSVKIVSYLSYWLLRRRPIQINVPDNELIYINERFVLAYILDYLELKENGKILERDNKGLNSFCEELFYYLKYRDVSPKSIELMLMAFFAGQIYQEKNYDLGNRLPEVDYL